MDEPDLATVELLNKLTRNPLETLCTRFGVDHALSGKAKGILVQRLVAVKRCVHCGSNQGAD